MAIGTLLFADANAQTTRQKRPHIPIPLDRITLQTYLDTIEQPRIASTLKINYFGGRTVAQSILISEGFALLKTSIAKEPIASKRWFYLQNVRGWASFRNSEIPSAEGFAAYVELFEQADKAKAAGTVYAVQTALNDWVATVSNKLGRLRGEDGNSLRDDERTTEVCLKAWSAYISLLRQTEKRWNGREPDWNQAIERLGADEEFVAVIVKNLADPQLPRTFSLLFGAATALSSSKPMMALELFEQAKSQLPQDVTDRANMRAAQRFFGRWQRLLQDQKKNKEAIEVASTRVTVIGSGYANLLQLQLELKDEVGASTTLKKLASLVTPEQEINAAARMLNTLWSKERTATSLADQSKKLLQTYLQSLRRRSVSAELEARWHLGWLLSEQKQNAEAKAALNISELQFDESRLDSQSQLYLKSIREMQAKLVSPQ